LDKAADYRLLLYAKPGQLSIDKSNTLIEPLSKLGFLGDAIPAAKADYYVGAAFTDLITFLGCSPEIVLSPQDGENYCFIHLHEFTARPVIYQGKNTRPPFCKQCKQDQVVWQNAEKKNYCDQCTLDDRATNWVWKKTGVLSRLAISVFNIYPHEAVPSAQLLNSLSDISGVAWGHAYI